MVVGGTGVHSKATVEVDIRKKMMKGATVGGTPRSNRNKLLYSEAEKQEIIKEYESVELMRSTWYVLYDGCTR